MLHLHEDRQVIRIDLRISTVLESHQKLERFIEAVGNAVGRLRQAWLHPYERSAAERVSHPPPQ